jgi:hypothetical protein
MSSTLLPSGVTAAAAAQQIDSGVKGTLTAADTVSADRIQNLSWVYQARVSRLSRTVTELAARSSAPTDIKAQSSGPPAELTAAQQALAAAQTTVARIAMVQRQATTSDPQVAAAGWALHGRVYDANLQPLAGHTVFLSDDQKNYLSEYGFAYTDSTGYFQLLFAGSAAAPAMQEAAPSPVPSTDLFLQIANTAGKPVYLSATAFEPVVGNATYTNVTLPAGEPVLGDPPDAIRKVALPPAK